MSFSSTSTLTLLNSRYFCVMEADRKISILLKNQLLQTSRSTSEKNSHFPYRHFESMQMGNCHVLLKWAKAVVLYPGP